LTHAPSSTNIWAKAVGDLTMESSANAIVPLPERLVALRFELAGQRFALRLADVDEVVRACALQALPKAPSPICGVLNVRGEIVPVLDLRRRFELTAKTLEPSDYFVLARLPARRVGLLVDRVIGIETLSVLPIAAAPNLPLRLEYVAGVAAVADGVVLIHDLATFLDHAETELLEGALRARAEERP